MDYQRIKKTLDGQIGKDLKEFLMDEVRKLDSISNVKDLADPKHQAIEVKAQKKALEKLKGIFSQILTWEQSSKGRGPKENNFGVGL